MYPYISIDFVYFVIFLSMHPFVKKKKTISKVYLSHSQASYGSLFSFSIPYIFGYCVMNIGSGNSKNLPLRELSPIILN